MRRDHRPHYIKSAYLLFQQFYANRYLRPQFDTLGYKGVVFIKPWHVEVFGEPVAMGNHATIIASSDKKVRLTVWSQNNSSRGIQLGDYCLLCPGVRISAATQIEIGDHCMLASSAYITDSDWHGIYNRSEPIGVSRPVVLSQNVWVGDSAIICKGVTIGKNSIIGAGSVVVTDIPDNAIAAGNPARVVKTLDPLERMTSWGKWNTEEIIDELKQLDMDLLQGNTLFGWCRSMLFPQRGD